MGRSPKNKLQAVLSRLKLSEEEAVGMLKSLKMGHSPSQSFKVTISVKSFSFGYFSDAHIGNKMFNPQLFEYMVKFFQREKPDFILNPGDNLEGMSGRPGHVYELSHIGLSQQIGYAEKLYRQLDNFDHYPI